MNTIELMFDNIGNPDDTKTQSNISKLRRQVQSSNINVILGAGFSYGVSELLGNIEKELFIAEYIEADDAKVLSLQKKFFASSILPLVDADKTVIGETERVRFLSLLGKIVGNRQSSILHKIVNVFTTNYDMLLEAAFEKSNLEYIDGFSGKLKPTFSTANYGMIFSRQTSISSMTSEVVTFNLYKVHGSLNWQCEKDAVICCDHIAKIKEIAEFLDNDEFSSKYNELAIINPTKEKLSTTVLNMNYYDQLRMFCNELEKSNTILLSFGFSFNDEHIRQMTLRSLKGNPTLSLIIFSFDAKATENYKNFFDGYSNATVVQVMLEKEGVMAIMEFTHERVNAVIEEIYNGTK